MIFYAWKLIGVWKMAWENHAFPEDRIGADSFKSLFGKKYGALNGEGKGHLYCPQCLVLAPIAEEKAQEKERARVARLELKRPLITEKIIGHLSAMPIDELVHHLMSLKNK